MLPNLQLNPQRAILYFDLRNTIQIKISYGSGYFSVKTNDSELLKFDYDRSTQTITVSPLKKGFAKIIVEDLKLGLDLAHSDRAPLFCKDAVVESFFPVSSEGINTQRTRWEHGHMALMFKYAPILIWDALKTGKVNLLALALDLFVPPLALLVLLNLAIMLFALIYFWVKSNLLPLVLSVGLFLALGIAVMTAWVVHGRKVISLSMLLFAPVYACLKIPLYLRFLLDRQINWVRSSREGD